MEPKILLDVINFRHDIHMYPQIGFQQFQTTLKIKKKLIQFGVSEDSIKQLDPTGLLVTLQGQAQQQQNVLKKCIGLRADIDGLPMKQLNQMIPYKSKIQGRAHMCGHDGHTACLVGFVPLFLKELKRIPKNRSVKLFFQPAQQGPKSGAKFMIQKGCLQGVDQIYGFHNYPVNPFGHIWIKQGVVSSSVCQVFVKITGIGGHGSQPQKAKQCTRAGVKFYTKAYQFLDQFKKQNPKLIQCTLPILKAGQARAVISQSCIIQGTIRAFVPQLMQKVLSKFEQIGKQLQQQGFKFQMGTDRHYPSIVNQKQGVQKIIKTGKRLFGEQKAHQGQLPLKGAQDFSFFLQKIPGAYFGFTSGYSQQQQKKNVMVHNGRYDFNDKVIGEISVFWYQFVLQLFGLQPKKQ